MKTIEGIIGHGRLNRSSSTLACCFDFFSNHSYQKHKCYY
ncbi:hypothetical protein D083_4536 [Dickeya solani RNS 08.23.3.1.A]|nr:hypothetical protein D083_4536 [Dickeya solani RNS 08.23.3.1.A]